MTTQPADNAEAPEGDLPALLPEPKAALDAAPNDFRVRMPSAH